MTDEKQFRTILTKYTLCHKIENSFATALNHSLAITVISQYNITEIIIGSAHIVCRAASASVGCPSICLPQHVPLQQSLLLWHMLAGDID